MSESKEEHLLDVINSAKAQMKLHLLKVRSNLDYLEGFIEGVFEGLELRLKSEGEGKEES